MKGGNMEDLKQAEQKLKQAEDNLKKLKVESKESEIKEEMPITKKVDIIMNSIEQGKIRTLKIPRKSKVRSGKIKKGWMGIVRIDENGNLSGEKQKVSDFTYQLKDGTYHTTDGREILFWDGKFPVVVQPTWKINPLNLRLKDGEKNETYGQKYIMARMLKDAIVLKSKAGSWIIWLIIGAAVLFGINYFFGK